jgi:hypothetical protein
MDRIARIKVLWLIKREEAAIRITDGTENPSPPWRIPFADFREPYASIGCASTRKFPTKFPMLLAMINRAEKWFPCPVCLRLWTYVPSILRIENR